MLSRVNRRRSLLLVALISAIAIRLSGAIAAESPIVIHSVEEEFEYIRDNLRNAVLERGMVIANELHASDMLNRTAPDLGFDKNVFLHAASIEFCNALISHKLVIAHPGNMVLCPFTISVYVLNENPDRVYVAYRTPTAGGESTEVVAEVAALLAAIVAESLE